MLNEAETSISCASAFVSRVFIYVVVLHGINGWLESDTTVHCSVARKYCSHSELIKLNELYWMKWNRESRV